MSGELLWFNGPPDQPGLYFFARKPENWEIADIVSVRRIQEPGGIYCEVLDGGDWKIVKLERYNDSLWCGPIPTPGQPHPALLSNQQKASS